MRNIWYISLFVCVVFLSCKTPVVILATQTNITDNNCEVIFFTDKKYSDIESFKTDFHARIIKEARRCKCDTLMIDLNDIFNMNNSTEIWGVCKSERLKLNKDKK